MRSEMIFVALGREQNRYMLSQLIAKATRKLHRPHTRVPDTMNDALALFGAAHTGAEAATLEPVYNRTQVALPT
jgi:hypothetical protein